jgi:hypothetical protein
MMKRIATSVGLVLCLGLHTVSAETKETKKDEEQQEIILSQPSDAELISEGSSLFTFTGVGMFAASGGDIATTEWGLNRPGIYEGNPVSTHRGVRIATHVVAPALVWWTTEELHKKGQKKLALAIRIGLMVAYSYAAAHNLRTIHSP